MYAAAENLATKLGIPIPAALSRLATGKPQSVTLTVVSGYELRNVAYLLTLEPYLVVSVQQTAQTVQTAAGPAPPVPPAQQQRAQYVPTGTTAYPVGVSSVSSSVGSPGAPPIAGSASVPGADMPTVKTSPVVPNGGVSPAFNMSFSYSCNAETDVIRVQCFHKLLNKLGVASSMVTSAAQKMGVESMTKDPMIGEVYIPLRDFVNNPNPANFWVALTNQGNPAGKLQLRLALAGSGIPASSNSVAGQPAQPASAPGQQYGGPFPGAAGPPQPVMQGGGPVAASSLGYGAPAAAFR